MSSTGQMSPPERRMLRRGDEIHLKRRLFHIFNGLLAVTISILVDSKENFLLIVGGFFLVEVSIELLRLRIPTFGSWIHRYTCSLMRCGEEGRLSGIPFYALGVFISFVVFPKSIATLAVLYLGIGDPVASVVGVYRAKKGRIYRPGWFKSFSPKSIEGALACFVICSFINLIAMPLVFSRMNFGEWNWFFVSLLAGICAMVAELIPTRTDDNLSLPLISGSLVWLITSFLGYTPGLIG
ncbi:MAG: hypothetical protein COV44_08305 [Deltaproteobacteria bacterium CG11_big_fil_rev_8_21_14_0_20_45_16]|nr:MAG: hypothetical protein COV44_08305 [Deltaproteobacteria bacterium CG11_big_fil_rev_8_21_14_0_20_45_16]